MILKDKVVVVTGASEGIGRAIAERLSKEGAVLALTGLSGDKLQEVANNINSGGGKAEAFVCDLRDINQVRGSVEAIAAKFGSIDVLINNAGIWQKVMQLDQIEDSVIDDVIATNLKGTIAMTKYVLPHLRAKQEETAIINIVSRSGVTAKEGQSIYAASKYGAKGFTDVLRVDLKDTKIRIGAVYQAGVNTHLFSKTGEDISTDNFTEPQDLADAVAYMLNRPAKIWLTEIHVNY
jgi:NADP-dependent 3-hydroxy acid dehydrogenase YdfG